MQFHALRDCDTQHLACVEPSEWKQTKLFALLLVSVHNSTKTRLFLDITRAQWAENSISRSHHHTHDLRTYAKTLEGRTAEGKLKPDDLTKDEITGKFKEGMKLFNLLNKNKLLVTVKEKHKRWNKETKSREIHVHTLVSLFLCLWLLVLFSDL
jgi:hypothetical protein